MVAIGRIDLTVPSITSPPTMTLTAGRPASVALTTSGFPAPTLGELSTQSDAFRSSWAAHNVRYHQTGIKRLNHPVVGDLEFSYEVMELSGDTELRLAIFTAEPSSRSEDALNLLASWAATPDQLSTERPAEGNARRA